MAKLATSGAIVTDVFKHERLPQWGYDRDNVTVNLAAATTLKVGTVLGKITATGKYVPRDAAASDGSQVASAIVRQEIDVPATTDTSVVVVGGARPTVECVVLKTGLVFAVAQNSTQVASAIKELEEGKGFRVIREDA